jgi:hypothetical protein
VWSIDLPADDPSLDPATGLGYTIRYPDRVEQTLAAQPAGTTFNVADLVGPDALHPITTANGASAYQVAVANGYQGTEAEWVAMLTSYVSAVVSADGSITLFQNGVQL